jgi:hypothetical protein
MGRSTTHILRDGIHTADVRGDGLEEWQWIPQSPCSYEADNDGIGVRQRSALQKEALSLFASTTALPYTAATGTSTLE